MSTSNIVVGSCNHLFTQFRKYRQWDSQVEIVNIDLFENSSSFPQEQAIVMGPVPDDIKTGGEAAPTPGQR